MTVQLSMHGITRITARVPEEFLPQKRGEKGFWTQRLLLWSGNEIVAEILAFSDELLALPGEKEAALAEEHARAVREASEERAADEAMFRTTPMELPF